jgi:ADP-ribosylglycohydrolase
MLGAIAGDIIGSVYESCPIKNYDFPLFDPYSHPTDDTVLTVALADSILTGKNYGVIMKDYFSRYPNAGYGENFTRWALSLSLRPYNSWGNGSAMRVRSPGPILLWRRC